jgi:hypothetical protein
VIDSMGIETGKGWSVRVVSPQAEDSRYPVTWYIVAESDPQAAIAAVRNTLKSSAGESLQVNAVQQLPLVFQGRRLRPGEVAYLYKRGAPRS